MGLNSSRIRQLEERLDRFEQADKNGDGVVTHKEMEVFYQQKNDEINRLKYELERVQTEYNKLLNCNAKPAIKPIPESQIDRQQIEKFADSIIEDPSTNIYGFPDALERRMYINSAYLTLAGIEKVISNFEFDIMNHRVKMVITPKE